MKIIDNSPVYEPNVGVIVEEACSVGQFLDSCIYIIAAEGSPLAQKSLEVGEGMRNWHGDYFNTYSIEAVPCVELANHPKIQGLVEERGCNLIMQLDTPGEIVKRFIAAKTEAERLYQDVALVAYDAERIYQYNIAEALKRYIISNPGDFEKLVAPLVSNKRFVAGYLAGLADKAVHPTFGMAARSIGESLDFDSILAHKKRLKYYKELSNNIRNVRKFDKPEMTAMLNVLMDSLDASAIRFLCSQLSPGESEKIFTILSPQYMAEKSAIDLEVRSFNHIDSQNRNNGIYRLIMKKRGREEVLHFGRSGSFVLYLIYLIDRKKNGDNVATLDIKGQEETFGKLYREVYRQSGKKTFDNMVKDFNAQGENREKTLHVVLGDIRKVVGAACEKMREPSGPFLIKGTKGHLTVLPEHITIPEELMTLV